MLSVDPANFRARFGSVELWKINCKSNFENQMIKVSVLTTFSQHWWQFGCQTMPDSRGQMVWLPECLFLNSI